MVIRPVQSPSRRKGVSSVRGLPHEAGVISNFE